MICESDVAVSLSGPPVASDNDQASTLESPC